MTLETDINLGALTEAINDKVDYDEIYYKAGDTYIQVAGDYESGYNCWAGFITSDKKDLRFSIPLPKKNPGNLNASVSVLNAIIRTSSGGYLNNTSSLDLKSLGTVNALLIDNRLNVYMTATNAFTNVNNNTPVAIAIRGITVTFS